MTDLLNDIEWSDPTLSIVHDTEWEAEVKADIGKVMDIHMRTSRSPWLRKTILKWPRYEAQEFPRKLADICVLVAAQENACRYCFGVARSWMRLWGYSKKMINNIERNVQMADMDEKERAFIRFCRNLSRSNPKPPKQDRDELLRLGYSPKAVAEMAFLIVDQCFVNRVSTFIAVPPMDELERLPNSILGRLLRPLIGWKLRKFGWTETRPLEGDPESFPGVVQKLIGLPAARAMNDALNGVFESEALSRKLKVLMFAVVANSLECKFCIAETHDMALECGFTEDEFNQALSTLSSPHLNEQEEKLLSWTRETIHFQNGPMQSRIRELAKDVGEPMMLEAIGVASLANSTVRLAVLLG
ncbi:carboxymuconolactone decarboxylase family protein [Tamlana sp. 2201CG12-4]|uniref:carboxymuconolactone decarboxylase family protein n=1 Tax=Tamlana sp. 2201CG12-4 TaxID=3112582 RepID=UPI002DBC3FC6|nr:carboxymuconolactone decarboxylase family protein [Tamlana sp. 2201CG12-4]MEC3906009.1 carboxymuconolactone decarboxylase family protein [Tamlana sp. 2201CG12-4]